MRVAARLSVVFFTLFATQLIQCGEGTNDTATPLCDAKLPEEIIYPDDTASDEAVERVWDKHCEAGQLAGAATLTAPAAGSEIAASDLELAWEQTIALAPRSGKQEGKPGSGAFPHLSFGVRTAAAHLPPVTGWVYLVEVRPEGREPLWIFTIERSWRPDPVAIYRMGAGEITVRITSAYLNTNVVEEGPWLGEERSFTVVAG